MQQGGGGSENYSYVEQEVTLTVYGNFEPVRAELAYALEQIDYKVLNEMPIQARRPGASAGAYGFAHNILEFPISLTIGVRSAGTNATSVIFAYVIRTPSGYITKGDLNTIIREAEAVVALANARALSSICPFCGVEVKGGNRFCGQCGTPPNLAASPAELDLLTLTANANAGYKGASWGTILLVIGLLFPYVLLVGSEDPIRLSKLVVVSILGGISGLSGFLLSINGLLKLRKSVNQPLWERVKELHAPVIHRSLNASYTSEPILRLAFQDSMTDTATDLSPYETKQPKH